MNKGDLVVELCDPAHIGVYTGRRFKGRLLVRWHKRCARWMRRSDLRLATLRDTIKGQLPVVPIAETVAEVLMYHSASPGLTTAVDGCILVPETVPTEEP